MSKENEKQNGAQNKSNEHQEIIHELYTIKAILKILYSSHVIAHEKEKGIHFKRCIHCFGIGKYIKSLAHYGDFDTITIKPKVFCNTCNGQGFLKK